MLRIEHLENSGTKSGHTGLLVIRDHFTKNADVAPRRADESTVQGMVRQLLASWFDKQTTIIYYNADLPVTRLTAPY